jgi:carotenoid cleavage dioxygenase-like enzyme
VTSRSIADDVALPRTAPTVRRRPYRYAYAQWTGDGAATGLVKVDVTDGSETVWREHDCFAGEPVFVPRADASDSDGGGDSDGAEDERAAEDDGVVLSVVLDRDRDRSFLLVLDARTFEAAARAWLPHALPLGFHGEFLR